MKPDIYLNSRRRPSAIALALLVGGAWGGGLVAPPTWAAAGAGTPAEGSSDHDGDWYTDSAAGLQFRVPFKPFVAKTGAQVEALILKDPKLALPDGVRYTSGLYDGDSRAVPPAVPYVLVWTHADAQPPTRAALDDWGRDDAAPAARWGLKFDPQAMRGIGGRREGAGLRSRFLMQVARGSTVFVGLFYAKPEDAALFDVIASSFTLTPGKVLRRDELSDGVSTHRSRALTLAATASALLVLALALLLRRGRRRLRSAAAAATGAGPPAPALRTDA